MFNFIVFLKILFYRIVYFPLCSFRKIVYDYKIRQAHGVPLRDRYGMMCFCGLAGSGKTMSLVYNLKKYREKYGNDIYIFTNFPCKYANATFHTYKQLVREFNKPVIVRLGRTPERFL